jgi:MFS family permease
MMLSLCQEYWQVFLAQGIVVGFGGGMLYIPAVAMVTTQFTTRRPIAVGLASSGSSIGRSVLFPCSTKG